MCTRPLSITKRIKTFLFLSIRYFFYQVRDHCPLQKGLRQLNLTTCEKKIIWYETIVHYNKD